MISRALVLLVAGLAAAAALPSLARGLDTVKAEAWGPTGADVGLTAPIVITWTAEMNRTSVEDAFRLTNGTAVWTGLDFQWLHASAPPWTSRASPLAPLPPLTDFVASVAPTATSLSGQRLDQDGDGTGGQPSDGLVWTFRTENGTPPRVLWTSPANGTADVPVAQPLAIGFDEPMDRGSVASALSLLPATSGNVSWDAIGRNATFAPALRFFYGTTYRAVLNGSLARDANGAPLDGNGDGTGGDSYAWTFTTGGNTVPPRVTQVTPPPGAGNVSVTTRIVLRFTSPMNESSVERAFSYAHGASRWNASDGAFAWSGTVFPDDGVSFNPYANLPFASDVTVTLNGSVARDRTGLPFDGNGDGVGGDSYAWTFTTEAVDTTRPTVVAVNPADGATGVPETSAVHVTFSEAMNRTSAEAAFALQDPVRTWTSADGWFSWVRGDEEFTFTPSMDLPFDADCTVRIAGTAGDVNGNALDGGGTAGMFDSYFRTRPEPDTVPPHVVSVIPRDGDTGVDPATRIAITFDDGMDRTHTELALRLADASGPDPVAVAIAGFAWDGDDHTVSFVPADGAMRWATPYVVAVGLGARDRAGNALPAAYSFRFTVEAWNGRVKGLVVSEGSPLAGATVEIQGNRTVTDAGGAFGFPSVVAGTYALSASKPGYRTATITVTVNATVAGATRTVDVGTITLVPEEYTGAYVATGVLLGVLGGALGAALWFRRRREPSVSEGGFEEDEEGPEDGEEPEAGDEREDEV